MIMNKYLIIAQIVVAILLITGILLQRREGGLGSAFGGGSDGGGSNPFSTRRGAEQVIFYATIVLSIAFLALALALKVTT